VILQINLFPLHVATQASSFRFDISISSGRQPILPAVALLYEAVDEHPNKNIRINNKINDFFILCPLPFMKNKFYRLKRSIN
jgi:hypothetical protein